MLLLELCRPGGGHNTPSPPYANNSPGWNRLLLLSADKSLAQPERKQATATEDFDYHTSYL
jgi:hypothetical protein